MRSLPAFILTRLLSVVAVMVAVAVITFLMLHLLRPEAFADPRPLLEQLVDDTQEAVSLSVPRHLTIVSIDHIAAPRVVSAGWVGEQLPLHCTSNGKMLLASLPEDELAAFLRRPLTALTPATITRPRFLRAELRNIRGRGFATEIKEFEPGLHAVSAAARDARDRPIAILSVSGPAYRLPRSRLDDIGSLLVEAAASLGAALS